MRAALAALLSVSMLALPSAALGSTAELAKAKKTRIAVLDIKTVGVLDPKLMEGLSSLLASEVAARPDLQVLGSADLRAMIGFDRERQLLGCTENSCMAEIGGALGVDYLLTSEGTKIGSTWLLTFALLDVSRTSAVKRLSKRTSSEDQLVDVAVEGVHELMSAIGAQAPAPGRPAAVAPASAVAVEPSASAPATAVEPSSGRSKLLTWSLVGGGLAVAAGGSALLLNGRSVKADWDAQQSPGMPATVSRADADAAVLGSQMGVGLIGVGGAALTWGLLRLILPEPSATLSSSAALVPGPGSATLLFSTAIP